MATVVGPAQDGEQFNESDDDVFYTTDRNPPSHSHRNGFSSHASRTKTIDRYGFIIGGVDTRPHIADTLGRQVGQRREKKWLEMLADWDYWMTDRFKKVRKRCRKGIPESLRARAWQFLSCANKLQRDNHNLYAVYIKQPISSKQEVEIKNDLHRTFPNHNMFADDAGLGQQNLYRVLRAYTAYNPKDGFCQAHAPLVSVLLMHMPEEQAFWCLVAMLDKYLPNYYSHQLEEVKNDGLVLFSLLHKVHPKLHKRLKEAGIDSMMFMVEWFMCLFSRDLPWPSVLRIWDIFFCEGVKILFRIALVLLKYCTAHLKEIPKDEYELLSLLKTKNMPADMLQPDFLIHEAYSLPIQERDMVREHKKVVKQKIKKPA